MAEQKNKQDQQAEQEKMFRFSMLEQEAKQFEQQLNIVEQQISELEILKMNLDEVENSKKDSEMLTPLGKNVFVKTSLLSKDLFVGVGAKTVVKKTAKDTKKIIDKDISKLMEARENLTKHLVNLSQELQSLTAQ